MSTTYPEFISSKLSELLLAGTAKFAALPEWCRFYLELGARVSLERIPSARSVVALSVPTKAFAAPLLAAGATIASTLARSFTDADFRAHLEFLNSLPRDTPLSYRSPVGNNVKKCLFDGCDDGGPEPAVRIKVASNGNYTKRLPPRLAFGLEPMGSESYTLKYNQNGRCMVDDSEYRFLCSFLGAQRAGELLAFSSVESVVIGGANRFREEIIAMALGVRGPSTEVALLGTLLGVRNPTSTNVALRTLAIPAFRDLTVTGDYDPSVTILNGSNAILEQYGVCPRSNYVAILDRTEPRFADAANRIKDAFYRRLDLPDRVEPQAPPPAIEQIWFIEPSP